MNESTGISPVVQGLDNISPEILAAFEMNWNHFPFPVMLINKQHTIVAANKASDEFGVKTGIKCFSLDGGLHPHKGCKAAEALQDKVGKRTVGYQALVKQVLDTFWIPLDGNEDLYIHFSTDITPYAKPELFSSSD